MESSYILIITLLIFGVREIFCSPEPGLKRSQIVGGKEAAPGSIKYIVSIRKNGRPFCGGSIIKPNIIITAAHCTNGASPKFLLVHAGSSQLGSRNQIRNVISIVQHPSFYMTKTYINYDVALLKLEQPLNNDSYVDSIALIENQNFVSESRPYGLISGWGYTEEEKKRMSLTLQQGKVRIVTKAECERYIQGRFNTNAENMLCADDKDRHIDACQGDSGGPLVVGNKLVGITSFGVGCARANEFGVYTNIAQLRSWIDENIEYLEQQENNFYYYDYDD